MMDDPEGSHLTEAGVRVTRETVMMSMILGMPRISAASHERNRDRYCGTYRPPDSDQRESESCAKNEPDNQSEFVDLSN